MDWECELYRITMDPGLSLPPFGDVDSYSDVGPHHEIDMDRPYHEGLDDSQRPTLDCKFMLLYFLSF